MATTCQPIQSQMDSNNFLLSNLYTHCNMAWEPYLSFRKHSGAME